MSPCLQLILGGLRSGKSGHAERLALAWQAQAPGRRVTVVATALPSDEEMAERDLEHRLHGREIFRGGKPDRTPSDLLEQDKSAFSRNPVGDRATDLWKCLAAWLDLIRNGALK